MSILFTADIQAEFSTLDKCDLAWKEILHICEKRSIKYIVVLGDLKQAMNPVDIRVIKWWQTAIRIAIKKGYVVILLRGNHDLIGNYSGAEDWFSILKRAGAIVFNKPGAFIADDITLYLLPYTRPNETRLGARKCKEMASKSTTKTNILCFHANLLEARYSQNAQPNEQSAHSAISWKDLDTSFYNYCIGGDIHLPQRLGEKKNVYYVGSPFCTSWGEVNQRKRYLIVRGRSINSVDSRIPRWFDPSVHGFKEATESVTYVGSRIRISVQCDASQNYGRRLEKARRKAERKYKGADIYVVPKFTDTIQTEYSKISTTDSDSKKLERFVEQTDSKLRLEDKNKVIEYMLEKLSHFSGGLRTASKVKFIRAIGTNFLSFKHIDMDLTKKGITLIQGINEDRNKKSNGSGKTSLVQLFPVAWFGHTFKEQKADSWANRHRPKEPAFAEAISRTAEGKIVKVVRGRRPPLLRMYVDGKEVSSGMRSTDREGTQQQIEKVTGFTWQTLANAVYIDRTIADAFLSGTRMQRTAVLSRFQNLERFERALGEVKKDVRKNAENINYYNGELHSTRSIIKATIQSIGDIKKVSNAQLKNLKAQIRVAKKEIKKFWRINNSKFQYLVLKVGHANELYKDELRELSILDKEEAALSTKYGELKRKLAITSEILLKKDCPTCHQPVSEIWMKSYRKETKDKLRKLKGKLNGNECFLNRGRKQADKFSDEYDNYQNKLSKLKEQENGIKMAEEQLHRQYAKLQREKQSDTSVLSKAKRRLKKLQHKKEELKHKLKKLDMKRKMYDYVCQAFGRDGIPAFLNRSLVPVLNKAAAYYAELFSDSEVGVQFVIEGGDFVPKIINASGGAEIDDQSEGERALAGLIASFALREAAPQCNVLILDEPGAGLDDITARQFARSLQVLVKRFGAIYVVTHNQAILSELSNERIITVRKHNKISKVENSYAGKHTTK